MLVLGVHLEDSECGDEEHIPGLFGKEFVDGGFLFGGGEDHLCSPFLLVVDQLRHDQLQVLIEVVAD